MSEHPDSEPERELEVMEERAERLEDEIEAERTDWEHKKQDPNVPGATGEPGHGEEDLPPDADAGEPS